MEGYHEPAAPRSGNHTSDDHQDILVALSALGRLRLIQWPRQQATRERTPRYDADAEVLDRREHLTLLLAVEQRVVILHRDERREVMCDRVVCAQSVTSGRRIAR